MPPYGLPAGERRGPGRVHADEIALDDRVRAAGASPIRMFAPAVARDHVAVGGRRSADDDTGGTLDSTP